MENIICCLSWSPNSSNKSTLNSATGVSIGAICIYRSYFFCNWPSRCFEACIIYWPPWCGKYLINPPRFSCKPQPLPYIRTRVHIRVKFKGLANIFLDVIRNKMCFSSWYWEWVRRGTARTSTQSPGSLQLYVFVHQVQGLVIFWHRWHRRYDVRSGYSGCSLIITRQKNTHIPPSLSIP